ncbi:hypothetical protein M409DRAFT_25809 [Zasmidium cellare ATCC 36951]|uniref:2EXR domain-containing protein n=1 Tax=Zasmidium cellare ATCC 36951 TaxID=1080233 RepID=A0A6A6CEF9_ZASCE|nr:uncharacterized protein M409DRAFT_25809 [Zasmidium cellare ATCC 36951]KAF2164039.1 hypothetical protein M409DRAFT_25809 [Zasmidium cellare ATCC 36951]
MSRVYEKSKHFRFLDLPKELREEIYQYLMPQPTNFSVGSVFTFGIRPSCRKSASPTTPYSISQICREIRYEALFTYYSSTPFTFDFLWHKDIESARRWLACQDETAISSMRDITFRHGSLDFEHHALILVDLRKTAVSVLDPAFKACLEGKMVHIVVKRLQAIVDGLSAVDGRTVLTKDALARMFDAAGMMFGVQWPAGRPVTLCETLY